VPSAVRVFSKVMGEAVELPDKPRRIVSLSPSITEMLFEMGLGDRVAGVTVYCHRPSLWRWWVLAHRLLLGGLPGPPHRSSSPPCRQGFPATTGLGNPGAQLRVLRLGL